MIQQKDPNCYSTSSDVYAYGCVLFEMFSEKLPHTPISNKEQVRRVKQRGDSYIYINTSSERESRLSAYEQGDYFDVSFGLLAVSEDCKCHEPNRLHCVFGICPVSKLDCFNIDSYAFRSCGSSAKAG